MILLVIIVICLQTMSFTEFLEPIDLCVDSRGRFIIADTACAKVISQMCVLFIARWFKIWAVVVKRGEIQVYFIAEENSNVLIVHILI